MKPTSQPTAFRTRCERVTPTAASVSGHRSSTHIARGARFSRRSRIAGRADVIGDVSQKKIASKRRPRSFQGPSRQPQTMKLR